MDGVGRAVEDHIEDRTRPAREPPVLDLVVGTAVRALAGAEREQHHIAGRDLVERLREPAHRRVRREHPAVDERALAGLHGLEVGGRRRGGARDQREREVVLGRLARLAGLEEVGTGQRGVVGGDDQVRRVSASRLCPRKRSRARSSAAPQPTAKGK